jgi:hypothetical protein
MCSTLLASSSAGARQEEARDGVPRPGRRDGLGRDGLAKVLYSPPFPWLNKHINRTPCHDDFNTLVTLVDLPSPQNSTARVNGLDQFVANLTNERLHGFVQMRLLAACRGFHSTGLS